MSTLSEKEAAIQKSYQLARTAALKTFEEEVRQSSKHRKEFGFNVDFYLGVLELADLQCTNAIKLAEEIRDSDLWAARWTANYNKNLAPLVKGRAEKF